MTALHPGGVSRPRRIQRPGMICHVGTRGDRHEPVYVDDEDRWDFLGLLTNVTFQAEWRVLSYCFLGNHYHLVLEVPHGNLAWGMHRLNSIFAGADTNLFQVSSNGKFYFAPSTSSVRPFVNGGVGAYAFNPGSVKFGGNVGGGLLFVITPRFGVQGSYNFHAVNTSGSTFKFSTVQGGVRFVF